MFKGAVLRERLRAQIRPSSRRTRTSRCPLSYDRGAHRSRAQARGSSLSDSDCAHTRPWPPDRIVHWIETPTRIRQKLRLPATLARAAPWATLSSRFRAMRPDPPNRFVRPFLSQRPGAPGSPLRRARPVGTPGNPAPCLLGPRESGNRDSGAQAGSCSVGDRIGPGPFSHQGLDGPGRTLRIKAGKILLKHVPACS